MLNNQRYPMGEALTVRGVRKLLTLSQSVCHAHKKAFTNLNRALSGITKKTGNNSIQKNFKGLQFRNRSSCYPHCPPALSLTRYIFVNSARFFSVSEQTTCPTLKQANYKNVLVEKAFTQYRQTQQRAETKFQKKMITFL